MEQKTPQLSAKQERAAVLSAEDELSNGDIGRQCGVGRTTIVRWKAEPHFAAAVAAHIDRLSTEFQQFHIARREKRIAALDDRWQRLRQVVEARAADPEMADVPGGASGLLIRTYKLAGTGPDAQLVPEYTVDTGLLREARAHEQQAAQEAGQWSEKREVMGDLMIRQYIGIDPADV